MCDPIESLKALWIEERIPIRPGASPEALAEFEARYGVVLPPLLRSYFEAMNGMVASLDDWAYDRDMNRFWPLAEFVPIRDFQNWGAETPAWMGRWFGFADYSINCHAYAIRLSADPDEGGPVALWDFGAGLYSCAPTFARFVEAYLIDRDEIFRMVGELIEGD